MQLSLLFEQSRNSLEFFTTEIGFLKSSQKAFPWFFINLPGHMVGHVYYKGEEENEPFVQFLSETAHQCWVFDLEFLYLDEGLEGQHRLRT